MLYRSCLYLLFWMIFLGTLVLMLGNIDATTFNDSDTAWHMVAGDLIRKTGNITPPNTWSFTAPEHAWVNVSWLWDVLISYLREKAGWFGPVYLHSATIALSMAILFIACFLRSESGIASFFAVLLVVLSMPLPLRSLWANNLFLCVTVLISVLIYRRGWKVTWWYAVPAMMPLWVNIHGGFIIAIAYMGAFGVMALYQRNWNHALHLIAVGMLCVVAMLASPFGIKDIFLLVFSMLDKPSLRFTNEFLPTLTDWGFFVMQLYVPVFLYHAMRYGFIGSLAEHIVALGFLLLAFTCVRYWPFFFIFTAPLLAAYIARDVPESTRNQRGVAGAKAWVEKNYETIFGAHGTAMLIATTIIGITITALLATPASSRLFKLDHLAPFGETLPAVQFIEKNYPHRRFMNDYGIAATVLMLSDSRIPVFIDGRVESAYPNTIVEDFFSAWSGKDWEKIFDKYRIDGVIAYTHFNEMRRLVANKPGWKEVYRDEYSVVYIRK